MDVSSGADLEGIHGATTTNVVTVGRDGAILGFDGGDWTRHESGMTTTLRDVWSASESVYYVVGNDGVVLRRCGAGW